MRIDGAEVETCDFESLSMMEKKSKGEMEAEVVRERKSCVIVALVSLRDPSEGVLVVVLIIGIDFVVASLALDDNDVVSSTADLV